MNAPNLQKALKRICEARDWSFRMGMFSLVGGFVSIFVILTIRDKGMSGGADSPELSPIWFWKICTHLRLPPDTPSMRNGVALLSAVPNGVWDRVSKMDNCGGRVFEAPAHFGVIDFAAAPAALRAKL